MAFLPFAQKGKVTGIGFVKGRAHEPCAWDEVKAGIDEEIDPHLSQDKNGDAEADAFKQASPARFD